LKKFNEIDVIKRVLFNDNQKLCFEYLSRPFTEGESVERHFTEIYDRDSKLRNILVDYFAELNARKGMSDYDEILFDCLSADVKQEIQKKVLNIN
jgi:hypothetical protein